MRAKHGMWHLLTMHCDEVVPYISHSLDEELSRSERVAVRIHVLYCTACRRYRRHLIDLREAIRLYFHESGMRRTRDTFSLSDAARERIQGLLDSGM